MGKAYLLPLERSSNLMLLAVKSDSAYYTPGAPGFFGGTKDYDASKKESDKETIKRELSEESSNKIRLLQGAQIIQYTSASGGMNFYWTADFVEEVRRFTPNKEVKDIISVDALSLQNHATTPKAFADYLLMLAGTTDDKAKMDFKQSHSVHAMRHWVLHVFPSKEALAGPKFWSAAEMRG
jgi:hypothetical protein